MANNIQILKTVLKRKLVTLVFLSASSFFAFASLGDGNKSPKKTGVTKLLSNKYVQTTGNFSLKSNYQYRGNSLFGQEQAFSRLITLNTTATFKKGNTTYTIPLKKQLVISKISLGFGIPEARN